MAKLTEAESDALNKELALNDALAEMWAVTGSVDYYLAVEKVKPLVEPWVKARKAIIKGLLAQ